MSNNRVFRITDQEHAIWMAEEIAGFGRPIRQTDLTYLAGNGLKAAAHNAQGCMVWVWYQWLLGTPKHIIAQKMEPFVTRGLEYRERTKGYDFLPLHDLYLLHCAIFASGEAQFREVVDRIADASGDKGYGPLDDGELYAAAWCGMLKNWILGNDGKAVEQYELIWRARRDDRFKAAAKPLVTPWLKRNWAGFTKAQKSDFEKLWARARKDWTVKAETESELAVSVVGYLRDKHWCWSHCGLAMLAHRLGAEVATDPFWFPQIALNENRSANC